MRRIDTGMQLIGFCLLRVTEQKVVRGPKRPLEEFGQLLAR